MSLAECTWYENKVFTNCRNNKRTRVDANHVHVRNFRLLQRSIYSLRKNPEERSSRV